MKKVVIIQARMTSTRLPGKVLADLAGKPMIAQQIRRLQACQQVDEIVIATTTNHQDDLVVSLASQLGIGYFRGDEHDVLGRYSEAARFAQADVVIRVTADCPLIDPGVTDSVIQRLISEPCDYASNVLERTYPRGLDVEAFFYDTLVRMQRLAKSPTAREHVTVFAYSECPNLFLRASVKDDEDNSDLRWTVDTQADLEMVRTVYEALNLGESIVSYTAMLAYIRQHPEISTINQGIETWSPDS